MPDGMPVFDSEKEFKEYFKKDREICDKHRNPEDETLSFNDLNEFKGFLEELLGDEFTFTVD